MSATPPTAAGKGRRGRTSLRPAATAFDLLDGAFVKVARARLVRLLAVGAVLLGIVFLAVQSLLVRLEAGELDSARATADERLVEVKRQVAQEADTGGLNRDVMEDHLATLGYGAAVVAHNDLALQELLRELETRTPGSVTLSSVAVAPGEPVSGVVPYTVTMTATAPGYDTAFAYRDALRSSPFLTDLALTWTGSDQELSLQITAGLATTVETPRASQFRSQFAEDFDPAKVLEGGAPTAENAEEAEGTDTGDDADDADDTAEES